MKPYFTLSLPQRGKAAVLFFISFLVLTGCSQENAMQTSAPVPAVSVYSVQAKPIGFARDFVARTESSKEAGIKARVEGELIARHFEEGRVVEKGQLLFEIDPASYKASLNQAQAELESKRSVAERAKRNLKRGQEVSKKGFISQSDLDKLIAEDLQAKAAVAAAESALEKAELNLSYTKISAPFKGRIGKVAFNVGNIVGPSVEELAHIQVTDPMYVNFQVEESEFISYLQERNGSDEPRNVPFDITLKLPNNKFYDKPGQLVFADTQVESGTGTIELRAQFDNPKGIVLPGLFVTLFIESKEKQSLALVPQSAVQSGQQGKSVLIVDNENKVIQRFVTLGRRIDAMWVVEAGLEENERIVIEGLQKVRSGVEVKPVEKVVDPVTGTVSDLVK
ncbi:efflux RND transporter periplasmic adaptor subunit [Thalassotalea sp. M1531]|uniref:Efflux RND transporter periplasmic adaptor subunit n=1 Tax=Thalassotalea algicola TaxID=2716224 RepID=A0A7Y0LBT0_9GAMM|nr:efflux RND transporter periplasmic adaptor subunit [Thalassotalea algicola]NMP31227.1 efflux RND transporter periplasmic adaptor subunit [Thalassotalea algicola]